MASRKIALFGGAAAALLLAVCGKLAMNPGLCQELVQRLPADRGEALEQAQSAGAFLAAQVKVTAASLMEVPGALHRRLLPKHFWVPESVGTSMAEWGAAARDRAAALRGTVAEWGAAASDAVSTRTAAIRSAVAEWADPYMAAAMTRIEAASGAACDGMAAVKAQILEKAEWAAAAVESRAKELEVWMPLPSKEVILAITVTITVAGCLCLVGLWRRRRSHQAAQPGQAAQQATEAKMDKDEAFAAALSVVTKAPTPSRRRSASPGMKAAANENDALQTLNEGTFEELLALRGIGEKSALKILEYRSSGEVIRTLDELDTKVGVGRRAVNSLAA